MLRLWRFRRNARILRCVYLVIILFCEIVCTWNSIISFDGGIVTHITAWFDMLVLVVGTIVLFAMAMVLG